MVKLKLPLFNKNIKRPFFWVLLVLFLFVFILNPLIDLAGVPFNTGLFLSLAVIGFYSIKAPNILLDKKVFVLFCIITVLLSYQLILSIYHDDMVLTVYNLLYAPIIYILIGKIIALEMMRSNGAHANFKIFKNLAYVFICIITINSIIVIVGFHIGAVKVFTETILYNPTSINYVGHPWRSRGLATAGGANLALVHGFALFLTYVFTVNKQIKIKYGIILLLIIFYSLLFIGRTGLLLSILGILIYSIFDFINKPKTYVKIFTIVGVTGFIISSYILTVVDTEILRYSLLTVTESPDVLREQSGIDNLIEFYTLPNDFALLLLGAGSYTGDFVKGLFSDPGYLKSFTAFGLPLSLLLYAAILIILFQLRHIINDKILIGVIILIFFIAEFKEPFIFKGYLARYIWLLVGVSIYMSYFKKDYHNTKRL